MADLTVAESAAVLGVSTNTVRRYIKEGRLAAYKPGGASSRGVWRIPRASIDALRMRPARFGAPAMERAEAIDAEMGVTLPPVGYGDSFPDTAIYD